MLLVSITSNELVDSVEQVRSAACSISCSVFIASDDEEALNFVLPFKSLELKSNCDEMDIYWRLIMIAALE